MKKKQEGLEEEAAEKRRMVNPLSTSKEHARSEAQDLEAEARRERQEG